MWCLVNARSLELSVKENKQDSIDLLVNIDGVPVTEGE